jgi:hypothetical protein
MIFSDILIESLKNQIDIVLVVNTYLKPCNSRKNKWRCPFCKGSYISFIVNKTNQTFHCFDCGIGGDVIKFVMEINHLSFQDSVRFLIYNNHKFTIGVKNNKQLSISNPNPKSKFIRFIFSHDRFIVSGGQEENIINNEIKEGLNSLLCKLPREVFKRTIELRYGLNGNKEHTLSECTVILRLSKERIRQIELRTILILKRSAKGTFLKELY